MSTATTPTCLGRASVVPGVDGEPVGEKNSIAWSYHGLPSPPHSAREDRRVSPQYSELSEAPGSATASPLAYSEPTTPVRVVQRGTDGFFHGMNDLIDAGIHGDADLAGSFSSCHPSESGHHSIFDHRHGFDTPGGHGLQSYSHSGHVLHADGFGLHSSIVSSAAGGWPSIQQTDIGFGTDATYLGTALFPMSHNFSSQPSPSTTASTSVTSLPMHGMHPNFDTQFTTPSALGWRPPIATHFQPQVIVPSQLSPEEHYFEDYQPTEVGSDRVSDSFAASAGLVDDFELVGPGSSMEDSSDKCEEDDYRLVKREPFNPDHFLTMHRADVKNDSRKKRPTRLARNDRGHAWYKHESCGIEVQCRGPPFPLDGPIRIEGGRSKKQHMCPKCGHRCDRSEHLKRHMGKHTDERNYPCPLPGCGKAIQRPDNAGDHFKTHLRPHKTGKRNKHFEWDELQAALLQTYQFKKASKMITNLGRWIQAGMPDPGNKRGPEQEETQKT